ncbi:MAG: nucleoid occlusion protein, partial [Firmicutes bacterium]|nr:nucleoid occlusion protein [Bacillota bacterium]
MLKQKEKRQGGGGKRVVIRDLRIFINTIRQAVNAIKKAGLKPEVVEKDLGDHWEVTIRLPKKEQ